MVVIVHVVIVVIMVVLLVTMQLQSLNVIYHLNILKRFWLALDDVLGIQQSSVIAFCCIVCQTVWICGPRKSA